MSLDKFSLLLYTFDVVSRSVTAVIGTMEARPQKNPNEAWNALKTKTIQKTRHFRAGNLLKTHMVILFSPNIIENKGGYASI